MNFDFILVEPATPGNVGSAARAIKTMGFDSLRLVNPCNHLSGEARKMAYASHDVLEKARICSSLKEAIEGIDFVVATTAKKRTVWNDYFTPSECIDLLKEKGETLNRVGWVFGREESGLNKTELELCDLRSTIPMSQSYPSLNLAQSIMIYAYEISTSLVSMKKDGGNSSDTAMASMEQVTLKQKANEMLDLLDITRNPNLSRRMMERLMQAGQDDIHLFLSFHRFLSQYLKGN